MKLSLVILNAFIALTALISGFMMVAVPDGSSVGLSLSLLERTPFPDFLIPGIVLALVVGGANLAALFLNMMKHPKRYGWSLAGGIVICGWIIAQLSMTQVFHWLQLLYFAAGVLLILLSSELKGKWII